MERTLWALGMERTLWAPGTERALERILWAHGMERTLWTYGMERALERTLWAHRTEWTLEQNLWAHWTERALEQILWACGMERTLWAHGTERALEQTLWAYGTEPALEWTLWAHGTEPALEQGLWAHATVWALEQILWAHGMERTLWAHGTERVLEQTLWAYGTEPALERTLWAHGTERALEQILLAQGMERTLWAPGTERILERTLWAPGTERALERTLWAHRTERAPQLTPPWRPGHSDADPGWDSPPVTPWGSSMASWFWRARPGLPRRRPGGRSSLSPTDEQLPRSAWRSPQCSHDNRKQLRVWWVTGVRSLGKWVQEEERWRTLVVSGRNTGPGLMTSTLLSLPVRSVCMCFLGPVLLTGCAIANRLLALKLYCQVLLKTRIDKLALKRSGHSYFCARPYWICICWSFPFRCTIYWRRVLKWILSTLSTECWHFPHYLTAKKKHVLN